MLVLTGNSTAPPQGISGSSDANVLKVEQSLNSAVVPQYEVFEITFRHEIEYENPFFDVEIDGDGIGDNGDSEDDNEGVSDAEERQAGTAPLDRLQFPTR